MLARFTRVTRLDPKPVSNWHQRRANNMQCQLDSLDWTQKLVGESH